MYFARRTWLDRLFCFLSIRTDHLLGLKIFAADHEYQQAIELNARCRRKRRRSGGLRIRKMRPLLMIEHKRAVMVAVNVLHFDYFI